MPVAVSRRRFTAEYWLADLNESVLSRHSAARDGTYQNVQPYTRGWSLAPQLLPECIISISDLFGE